MLIHLTFVKSALKKQEKTNLLLWSNYRAMFCGNDQIYINHSLHKSCVDDFQTVTLALSVRLKWNFLLSALKLKKFRVFGWS